MSTARAVVCASHSTGTQHAQPLTAILGAWGTWDVVHGSAASPYLPNALHAPSPLPTEHQSPCSCSCACQPSRAWALGGTVRRGPWVQGRGRGAWVRAGWAWVSVAWPAVAWGGAGCPGMVASRGWWHRCLHHCYGGAAAWRPAREQQCMHAVNPGLSRWMTPCNRAGQQWQTPACH